MKIFDHILRRLRVRLIFIGLVERASKNRDRVCVFNRSHFFYEIKCMYLSRSGICSSVPRFYDNYHFVALFSFLKRSKKNSMCLYVCTSVCLAPILWLRFPRLSVRILLSLSLSFSPTLFLFLIYFLFSWFSLSSICYLITFISLRTLLVSSCLHASVHVSAGVRRFFPEQAWRNRKRGEFDVIAEEYSCPCSIR